jgi:hypothetical protein
MVQTGQGILKKECLFLWQVYHLAHVRLSDLCDRPDLDDEDLHRKIWTCLENVKVHHTELLKDRYLDLIIMCSVYGISKVCCFTEKLKSFILFVRKLPS